MPTATLRALSRFRWTAPAASQAAKARTARLHTTPPMLIKDSMKDRTKIDRESNEYSKSGSDDQAAGKDSAFKPNEGSGEQDSGTQQKSQGDPLNVSPGNQEISQPLEPDQGGAQKSAETSAGEQKSSGGGSPAKGKKVTS